MCGQCAMGAPWDGTCQPHVQKRYVSLQRSSRGQAILNDSSLEMGRLHHWPVRNVLETQEDNNTWCDRTSQRQPTWFNGNYASRDPSKFEFTGHFLDLIRKGKVKSLLDAGAGGCTLEGHLRRLGLLKLLKPYVAFGAYDCSMLRICAERSAISFQWNWMHPLPVCDSCMFDLVFQAEGTHHLKPEDWLPSWTQLMAHVACGGHLFLSESPCSKKSDYYDVVTAGGEKRWCWFDSVKDWAQTHGHTQQKVGAVNGRWHILLEKRC